ncbi:hypothetical protein [Deinococcus sp. AJ005]|uniref:hypothetical protein n=1 Tax=Deinococcus sp. AJ005 TaxID=2652443 RepID=UPI00125CB67E|nr:hypothetical protein [Deinococcus sp. AJ005]QFP76283.1 hypothetical protein DAAJ005_07340 [Deinococcus sp. AJ005]
MRFSLQLALILPLLLSACKSEPDQGQLDASAKIFLDSGGTALLNTASHNYGLPCLDSLELDGTRLSSGILFGNRSALVDFIERHRLAKTTHERLPDGADHVILTPVVPYEANWQAGSAGSSNFCLGFDLLKAEAVPDAKTITAGASEPYIIQGSEAIATRLTFKVTGIPGGDFLDDLKRRPNLLTRGAMRPSDYDKEITLVATLPLKPSSFIPPIIQTK